MRDTFIEVLTQAAVADTDIMLLTADLGFGVLDKFQEQLPKQFLNVGVAEQNMTGVAAGLTMIGKQVFTYSIANFPTLRCLEQLRNDVCYHDCNVKVVAIGGGFSYGALGMSHHATEDLAILRTLPITVFAPCSYFEVIEGTKALIHTPGPAYLRLDKAVAGDEGKAPFELGKARELRAGGDLTFICTGSITQEALTASEQLEKQGISCRVLSMHTIKPIDTDAIIRAASETGGIISVEEHTIYGGLGAAIAQVCLTHNCPPRFFHQIGLVDGFSSVVGSQPYLRNYYKMDAQALINAATVQMRQHN